MIYVSHPRLRLLWEAPALALWLLGCVVTAALVYVWPYDIALPTQEEPEPVGRMTAPDVARVAEGVR